MVGGDVQVERLTSAAVDTKKRLEVEVIQPIKQWMVAYRTIAVRCRAAAAMGVHKGVGVQAPVGITIRLFVEGGEGGAGGGGRLIGSEQAVVKGATGLF